MWLVHKHWYKHIKISSIMWFVLKIWVWSVFDILKLSQVHVCIAALPGIVYKSLSHEYHYLIHRTSLTAKFYIQTEECLYGCRSTLNCGLFL
jgi:hypothetical protein